MCSVKRVTRANLAIYAALAGNLAIAAAKMTAAAFTGSAAMLAEGIHSLVDSADQLLLLFGRRRANRPPDFGHPFGHGQELYFWTFVVAMLIFGVGGGLSVYEGILRLSNPHPTENVLWSYLVLGIAALIEGASFLIGYRSFRAESGRHSFWRALRTSKDPTVFTVVLEDAAALIGLVIAFFGLFFADRFHRPEFDGAASVLIGLVLMTVAVLLARESKGLLVGEGLDPATLQDVCRLTEQDAAVERMNRPLTMYFGPDTILLAMEIQFTNGLSVGETTAAVDRIERAISSKFPQIRHIFIEAESITGRAREDRAAGIRATSR